MIVFAPDFSSPLYRVPAAGGARVALPLDKSRKEQVQHFPYFLPDGRHFLFFVIGMPETTGIYAGSLDGGDPKMITLADSAGSLLAPGTTISATIANEFTEAVGDLYTSSLIALGLILFVITFIVLALARYMLLRIERRIG